MDMQHACETRGGIDSVAQYKNRVKTRVSTQAWAGKGYVSDGMMHRRSASSDVKKLKISGWQIGCIYISYPIMERRAHHICWTAYQQDICRMSELPFPCLQLLKVLVGWRLHFQFQLYTDDHNNYFFLSSCLLCATSLEQMEYVENSKFSAYYVCSRD